MKNQIVVLGLAASSASAFAPSALVTNAAGATRAAALPVGLPSLSALQMTTEDEDGNIVSPFAAGGASTDSDDALDAAVATLDTPDVLPPPSDDELLELTFENVDLVLDEMRPYLIQDGGNVRIQEIDGPVVRLQLEGACGTCPSSTQTMKMGLERRLRERIPEIQEVVQAMPEGPELSEEQVDVVLGECICRHIPALMHKILFCFWKHMPVLRRAG